MSSKEEVKSKYYPGEDVKRRRASKRASKNNPTKLRSSITPGTVLILLSGRYQGKRVIFLKQLPSGLLLVTGPFKLNGVPLRRVDQAYVIATKTKVDVSSADVSSIADELFKAEKKKNKRSSRKKTEADFMEEDGEKKKKPKNEALASMQESVDKSIVDTIKADRLLSGYVRSTFTLEKGVGYKKEREQKRINEAKAMKLACQRMV